MRKLIITLTLLFAVAIILPELRPVLLAGSVCWLTGFMVGSQRKAAVDTELVQARNARLELLKG